MTIHFEGFTAPPHPNLNRKFSSCHSENLIFKSRTNYNGTWKELLQKNYICLIKSFDLIHHGLEVVEDNLEKSENKETKTEHLLQARNTNGNENKDEKNNKTYVSWRFVTDISKLFIVNHNTLEFFTSQSCLC